MPVLRILQKSLPPVGRDVVLLLWLPKCGEKAPAITKASLDAICLAGDESPPISTNLAWRIIKNQTKFFGKVSLEHGILAPC